MTGFIYNNNSYDVGYGSSKIEYASKGDSTLGYSMYGENIPEEPDKDKLLEWINIPQNINTFYGGDGYIYSRLDYNYNTEDYLEFYCCPIIGPNFLQSNKSVMVLYTSSPYSGSKLDAVNLVLNLRKPGSTLGKNYLKYSLVSPSMFIYYNEYDLNVNTITYGQWYKIGSYKQYAVINGTTHIGNTYGTYRQIEGCNTVLFSYTHDDNGFEGKFSYFNVYSDMTKTTLLHSYKPFLTPENEIIIKDTVTNKSFPLLSNDGTLDNITYEIAQN